MNPKQAAKLNSKQHRRALRRRIVTTLAALVVFWTTYALILPAITLEQDQAAEIVAPTEPALCTLVQTADGNHLTVTLRCDSTAGLPDDAVLAAREIPQGTADYQAAYDEAVRALSDENGVAVLNQLWLLDISVVSGGEKIEPAAAVQVSVEYADPVPAEEDSALQIVHFAGETPEVLEATVAEPDAAEITAFTFETESFSTFAFAKANYIGSLNGQSFAIVRDNGGKVALSSQALDATRLKAAAVTVSGNTLTSDDEITVWTFEHVRDNFYYIKSDDGKYLNLTATSLTAGDTPGLIEVYPIDSSGNTSGYVRLRSAEDSGIVVQNKSGSVSGGFQANRSTDNNTRIALYQSVDSSPYPKITAQKRSATELEGGKSYTIYQRVYNSEIGEYENYVVAGDGSLVYAFDDGDYVGYRTDKSTTWYLIEYADEEGNLTGYYDFYNAYTGNYLSPQSGGILSKEPLGLLLSGRGDGDYSTTIEGWDNAAKGYFGYSLDLTNCVLIPGAGRNSTEFSFAEATDFQTGELHTVDTVDSVANGIRIGMYDFSSRASMNLFNDDTWYQYGEFKQGLLKPVLGEDGLPVSRTGRSFSEIYNEKNFKGDANHLFLQSVYDATGYYEYNAFQNFAHYDQTTGDFTVYEEMGTPQNGAGGSVSSYYRGNFLPYNNLNPAKPATNTRLYDSLYGWVSLENPVFQGQMYLLKEATDYQFGTIIEADFLQAKNGLDENGAPVLYEFMGDDDLWVYIDGVMILDIGGVHSTVSGSIDFSTGVVDAGGRVTTTIKQCFQAAGQFPDGTPWDDDRVDEYFVGETFLDYSRHTMKMFYQERGSGASTLKMRFNLPVVQSGTFAVEKQLSGTDQQKYSNVQFAYQAFLDFGDGDPVALKPGMILSADGRPTDETVEMTSTVAVTYEGGEREIAFHDGVTIGGETYDNVFYLKPGESCVFSGIPENVKYYVQEIDVSGDYYETVMINEADMSGEGGTIPEGSAITAVSSSKTIQQRQRVKFENHCSPKNLRDLRITKRVENPVDDGATFEFRVFLESADGALTHYSLGDYYVVDQHEHYYQFVDGQLTDCGTEPVVCSQSGPYGTIAGLPDGYTIVIKGLLAGTDFYVEEIRNPTGYEQVSKTLKPGSYDPKDLDGADGKIKLGTDAEVVVTNHRHSTIAVHKIWDSDSAARGHAALTFALYELHADQSETLAQQGAVLLSDPVQTVTWPSVDAVWALALPEGVSLTQYVVREVTVGADGIVTPVPDGETISLVEGGASARYAVTYDPGEEVYYRDSDVHTRDDTVTNARLQTVSFRKVDISSPETHLPGAEFDLYAVTDGKPEPAPLYPGLRSGADGLLRLDGEAAFLLPPGDYALVETRAPAGYHLKTEAIPITVTADGVTYYDGTIRSSNGEGTRRDPDTGAFELLISNSTGYALPKSGGAGTMRYTLCGAALMGAVLLCGYSQRRKRERRSNH